MCGLVLNGTTTVLGLPMKFAAATQASPAFPPEEQ
jgi:hypothetical protein